MWKVSKDGFELLRSWLDASNDVKLKKRADRLMKQELMVFDYDEVMSILIPLSEKYPIYKFIDQLTPYVPVAEKKVNPEYEARLERLRRQQEDREYREMTRSVDPNQIYGRENLLYGFSEEVQAINRQLMVIFNTLLTVAGGFAFGYFGISYAFPGLKLDATFRMAIGLIIAAVIFFADLYFIVKGMDDLGEKPIKVSSEYFIDIINKFTVLSFFTVVILIVKDNL
uniref:Uncharacterized protein n=1 Tax=Setaria digitata TaxID=48799 RepID=A0A915PMK0_9BILA